MTLYQKREVIALFIANSLKIKALITLGVRVVVTRLPRWYDNTRGDVYEL